MVEMCGDNRFEIIAQARKDIIEATNIESSEDEMKVLDNFLFRCWQMGWLDRYDDTKVDRLKLVQETVFTVMNISNGNSTEDRIARNIARLFQNALDGSFPDFESMPTQSNASNALKSLEEKTELRKRPSDRLKECMNDLKERLSNL